MEAPELRIVNAGVFDSVTATLTGPHDVTVRDGRITAVTPAGGQRQPGDVDGTGKTLIPGLIDAHWHGAFTALPAATAQLAEIGYIFAHAVVSAEQTLKSIHRRLTLLAQIENHRTVSAVPAGPSPASGGAESSILSALRLRLAAKDTQIAEPRATQRERDQAIAVLHGEIDKLHASNSKPQPQSHPGRGLSSLRLSRWPCVANEERCSELG